MDGGVCNNIQGLYNARKHFLSQVNGFAPRHRLVGLWNVFLELAVPLAGVKMSRRLIEVELTVISPEIN